MLRFCAVRARALAVDRAVLPAAVVERELLVAVGVEDRRDEQHHRPQPVGVLAHRELAQQDLRRLLALDLARVDVAPGCARAACRSP